VKGKALVVVINFEKYLDTIKFKCSKIMLTMRIISSAKIVEGCDSLDQTLDGLLAQGGDTTRHNRTTTQEVLAELVIEHANAIRVCGHGSLLMCGL
jgi:hypothetical protein